MTPEQSQYLSSALSGSGPYSEFTQQYNPQQFSELFQKSFIDPAQQALQRQIIPGIKEQFLGLDESGSGSLNRALAQSASDVATGLGQQYMNFYNQQQQNKLGALGQLGNLAGQRTFQPHINQTQGILGPLLNAIAAVATGVATGGGSTLGGLAGNALSTGQRVNANKDFFSQNPISQGLASQVGMSPYTPSWRGF